MLRITDDKLVIQSLAAFTFSGAFLRGRGKRVDNLGGKWSDRILPRRFIARVPTVPTPFTPENHSGCESYPALHKKLH